MYHPELAAKFQYEPSCPSAIETKTPQIVKKDSRPDLDFIEAQSIT